MLLRLIAQRNCKQSLAISGVDSREEQVPGPWSARPARDPPLTYHQVPDIVYGGPLPAVGLAFVQSHQHTLNLQPFLACFDRLAGGK